MHGLRTAICSAVFLVFSAAVPAQTFAIPETLEARDIGEPDALQRMRDCTPRAKQEHLDRMLQLQARNDTATLTTVLEANDRAAVVGKGGLWMCVQMSPQRYPVLPVDAIAAAAKPDGGDPERLKTFYRDIAAALAETGFARALFSFASTGNAFVVFYAVSAENPAQLATDSRFLKKGEYEPSEYALRLDDPGFRAISVTSSGKNTQRDIFVGKYPARQIVDGYIVRKGNDLTRRFDFAGTTWKSPTALSTTYSFHKEGVLVYRNKISTSFGSWKLNDGVLQFEINKFSYHSAVLDEQGYLNAESRNSSRVGGAAVENRFKPRLFQEGNLAAEKEAREKLDGAFKALQVLIEAKRSAILAESAEEEQRHDPVTRKLHSLCDSELMPAILTIATERGEKAGEHCRSFSGARAEWKSSILKDGCQGRCLPF